MNKVRFNVYLKPKTYQRLKKYAEDECMMISEAINEIIDIYLDVNDVKRIKQTIRKIISDELDKKEEKNNG